MHDRPDALELVTAVRVFLEGELLPALGDARLRFQTLVAAHVLGIVERQLPLEEADLHAAATWLAEILHEPRQAAADLTDLRKQVREGNKRLCSAIREGRFDEPTLYRKLGADLRVGIQRKLRVANPRILKPSPSK
jgi:Domain of unknown function (DUF6285)